MNEKIEKDLTSILENGFDETLKGKDYGRQKHLSKHEGDYKNRKLHILIYPKTRGKEVDLKKYNLTPHTIYDCTLKRNCQCATLPLDGTEKEILKNLAQDDAVDTVQLSSRRVSKIAFKNDFKTCKNHNCLKEAERAMLIVDGISTYAFSDLKFKHAFECFEEQYMSLKSCLKEIEENNHGECSCSLYQNAEKAAEEMEKFIESFKNISDISDVYGNIKLFEK